jgi:RNA polymerase sigma factor (sigma-70 family)
MAWRSRASLRDPAALDRWLTQICLRRALRLRMRVWRRQRAETASLQAPDARGDDDGADLDHAVGNLSPRQRAVIVLHYRDGYTLDECAQLLRCGPGSVRQHLSRALASLRQQLSR